MFWDDVWADCLHYYGKDVNEMDGASALMLAERLPDVFHRDTTVEPVLVRSSTYQRIQAFRDDEPATEMSLLSDGVLDDLGSYEEIAEDD